MKKQDDVVDEVGKKKFHFLFTYTSLVTESKYRDGTVQDLHRIHNATRPPYVRTAEECLLFNILSSILQKFKLLQPPSKGGASRGGCEPHKECVRTCLRPFRVFLPGGVMVVCAYTDWICWYVLRLQ